MSDVIQQIKDRLNIIDIVSSYVELHKSGQHFKGRSPFSNEKTPSFYVSPDRGMYYCFSTNQGGDMFTFIQVMEGVEFKDALAILAEKANVELTKQPFSDRLVKDKKFKIISDAVDFYVKNLVDNNEAINYLKNRGVSDYSLSGWQIGYAPGPPSGGWRDLKIYLNSIGYSDKDLLDVGLIKSVGKGKDPFDIFRDRIVFPMGDYQGRVVAFSGRILHPNDKVPKYLNSPETEFYKKSALLYGYDKAKHGIRKLPFWLIVEGQFDVVMAHQAGYTNAVAVSGTALTIEHVKQLERLCNRVVLALDADNAGINAMLKAATVMLSRGLDLKIALLPKGKDPADMVCEDVKQLKKCIANSSHVIDFMLTYLKEYSRDDRSYKLKVREQLLPYVVLISNQIDRDHFISQISKKTGSSIDAIKHEITRLQERGDYKNDATTRVDLNANNGCSKNFDRKKSVATYIFVVSDLIPECWRKKIETMLSSRAISYSLLEKDVEYAEVEKFRFQIEETFPSLKIKQQAEEVVDRLNQYIEIVCNQSIRDCRIKLLDAENCGDESKIDSIMKDINIWQKVRASNRFDAMHLFDESPLD